MLCTGGSLAKSMSQYLIEQIAETPNISGTDTHFQRGQKVIPTQEAIAITK